MKQARRPDHRRAEITQTTLRAVPGILNPAKTVTIDTDPSQPVPMWDLNNPLEPS